MIEIEIENVKYKINETMSVKTWFTYSKTLTKIQKIVNDVTKATNINIQDLSQIGNNTELLMKIDPSYTDALFDIQLEQFIILYLGLVIEPKLSKTQIEDLSSQTYSELMDQFTQIINKISGESRINEIKKKQD